MRDFSAVFFFMDIFPFKIDMYVDKVLKKW